MLVVSVSYLNTGRSVQCRYIHPIIVNKNNLIAARYQNVTMLYITVCYSMCTEPLGHRIPCQGKIDKLLRARERLGDV